MKTLGAYKCGGWVFDFCDTHHQVWVFQNPQRITKFHERAHKDLVVVVGR